MSSSAPEDNGNRERVNKRPVCMDGRLDCLRNKICFKMSVIDVGGRNLIQITLCTLPAFGEATSAGIVLTEWGGQLVVRQ